MDKVRIALVLITIAISVGPLLGLVLVYRDNPLGLVIPPEINQLMNGGSPSMSDVTENPGQSNQTGGIEDFLNSFFSNGTIPSDISDIISEQPETKYDPVTRTFTASFKVKNPLTSDITVNAINGTVECDEHLFPIGPITLQDSVIVKAGGNATATITGQWTREALAHLETAHPGKQSIGCNIVGSVISFTTFGISGSFPSPSPISLGEIPLTGGT